MRKFDYTKVFTSPCFPIHFIKMLKQLLYLSPILFIVLFYELKRSRIRNAGNPTLISIKHQNVCTGDNTPQTQTSFTTPYHPKIR
jgi:hypothetical protein